MRSLALLCFLALTMLIGCSAGATKLPEAGPVSGTLARADGSPVGDVLLMLQPTSTGFMTSFEVDAEGKFSGEAIAGPYAWFVAKSAKAADADKALAERQKCLVKLSAIAADIPPEVLASLPKPEEIARRAEEAAAKARAAGMQS
jgi:hypothetical protein